MRDHRGRRAASVRLAPWKGGLLLYALLLTLLAGLLTPGALRENGTASFATEDVHDQLVVANLDPVFAAQVLERSRREGLASALALITSTPAVASVTDVVHRLQHLLGRHALDNGTSLDAILSACRAAHADGCVHGALEETLQRHGKSAIREILASCPPEGDTSGSCAHGLGHGLYPLFNETPGALDACAQMSVPVQIERCQSAVFMSTSAVLQRSVGGAAALAREGVWDGCASYSGISALACYEARPTAWVDEAPGTWGQMISWCGEAPALYIATCYQHLGILLSVKTVEMTQALGLCASATDADSCRKGLIDGDTAQPPETRTRICALMSTPIPICDRKARP